MIQVFDGDGLVPDDHLVMVRYQVVPYYQALEVLRKGSNLGTIELMERWREQPFEDIRQAARFKRQLEALASITPVLCERTWLFLMAAALKRDCQDHHGL